MHPAQAAIGMARLDEVDGTTEIRVRNAGILLDRLAGIPGIGLPVSVKGADPVWTNFVVRVDDRERIKRMLLQCGVDTSWGYLMSIDRISDVGTCPNARLLEQKNLYLPVWGNQRSVERMADCIKDAIMKST